VTGQPVDRTRWPADPAQRLLLEHFDLVHRNHGCKSRRQIARDSVGSNADTVAKLLNGTQFPVDEQQARLLVHGLGGSSDDEDTAAALYLAARQSRLAPPPSTAAPDAAPSVLHDGLLPDLPAFAGRASDVDQLLALLGSSEGGAVALTGLPGAGKTALAVHLAHLVRQRRWFAGGILFVNLHGYDAGRAMPVSTALAGFVRAFGVAAPNIPRQQGDLERLYRSLVARSPDPVLVIVDNVSTADQVTPFLVAGPSKVLLTSRRRLDELPQVHSREVPVLSPGDAVAMFTAAARLPEPIPDDLGELVAELTTLCGRLPLAIQIAAAIRLAEPMAPLTDLVAALRAAQDRLEMLQYGEHASVRAAFLSSYLRLDGPTKQLFRLLSLHPGSDFSAAIAAALADLPFARAAALVRALRVAHLVEPGTAGGRYEFHDLLRLFAAEQVAQDDPATLAAATERLLDYFVRTTRAADDYVDPHGQRTAAPFSSRAEAVAWLSVERANLLAAQAAAESAGRLEHVRDLGLALFNFLISSGADTGPVSQLAETAARRLGDDAAAAVAVANSVSSLPAPTRRDLSRLRQAREMLRRTGAARQEAIVLRDLGRVYMLSREWRQAEKFLKHALELAQRENDTRTQTGTLLLLAQLEEFAERPLLAAMHYQEAFKLARATDDKDTATSALINLATFYRRTGKATKAAEYAQQALETSHELGRATAMCILGNLESDVGRYQAAEEHYRQALPVFQAHAARLEEITTLANLSQNYLKQGRVAEARECIAQAEPLAQLDMYSEIRAELARLRTLID
jgi:tetratricopeptide (TPR) repeat protein